MIRSKFLAAFLIIVFLFPAGTAFAQTEISSQIASKLPGYNYHNIKVSDSTVFFFASDPKDKKIPFGWYKLNLQSSSAKPKRVLSSSAFSLIFQTAFSPDGKEMLLTGKTGEISFMNLRTGKKKRLGVFTSKFPSGEFSTYSFPAYTPDNKYILLFNSWENSLLAVDAKTKDIAKGVPVPGFWLKETGGELPPSGRDISVYEFLDGGKKVKFGSRQVLNLETLTKE